MRRLLPASLAVLAALAVASIAGASNLSTPSERASAKAVAAAASASIAPRMLTQSAIDSLACPEAEWVQGVIGAASRAGDTDLLAQWVPDGTTVTAVQVALDAKVAVCQSTTAATSGTPSPTLSSAAPSTASATASTTAASSSSGASAGESSSATASAIDLTQGATWAEIVANPPSGLETAVNQYQDQLGWNWDDAVAWANSGSTSKVTYELVVTGDNGTYAVTTVTVTSCGTLSGNEGCPDPVSGGGRLALVPLNDHGLPMYNGSLNVIVQNGLGQWVPVAY